MPPCPPGGPAPLPPDNSPCPAVRVPTDSSPEHYTESMQSATATRAHASKHEHTNASRTRTLIAHAHVAVASESKQRLGWECRNRVGHESENVKRGQSEREYDRKHGAENRKADR